MPEVTINQEALWHAYYLMLELVRGFHERGLIRDPKALYCIVVDKKNDLIVFEKGDDTLRDNAYKEAQLLDKAIYFKASNESIEVDSSEPGKTLAVTLIGIYNSEYNDFLGDKPEYKNFLCELFLKILVLVSTKQTVTENPTIFCRGFKA